MKMTSDRTNDIVRAVMRWVLAAFYSAAGVAHLVAPEKLLAITPSWVPFAPQVIFVTGLCELAGSVALLTKPLRWWAGVALALYAICVWPANIKHAIDGIELPYITNSWLYHGPRLAFQPVIVWWALYCAEVIDWPWRRSRPQIRQGRSVILLRDIRQDELSTLSELCLRSKAVWGYDDAFMRACRNELTLRPAELQTSYLQVAERDAIVVGLAQIKVVGRDADLMKLFVEPSLLGAGVGRLLFEWAANRARYLGADSMTIEADPGAVPFYERMGARQAGFAPSQSIAGRVLPLLRLELEKETGLPQ